MTNRSLNLTSSAYFVALAIATVGCPATIELQRDDAAVVDAWRPAPMPATRIAPREIDPWTRCVTALENGVQMGDPCTFEEGSTCANLDTPTVTCERGRVLLGEYETTSDGVCDAGVRFDGQCAEYELCSRGAGGDQPDCRDRTYRFCQPEIPLPAVDRPSMPFPDDVHYANREVELCAPILAAELGQPCSGVGGCAALGVTPIYALLVWCDGAYVHRAPAETSRDPLLGMQWDPTDPNSRGGCD